MTASWSALVAMLVLLGGYELWLLLRQRRRPMSVARSAHALLREEWFAAVSAQKGSEVLAVQTLRNSLMSATMTASTAVLALMGALTLAAPSLRQALAGGAALPTPTPTLLLEALLLLLLAGSLFASGMAVRAFHHAGFIGGMPVESDARRRWNDAGAAAVRRGGLFYSWALRLLVLVLPVLAALLLPLAGAVAALVLVALLGVFDRTGSA